MAKNNKTTLYLIGGGVLAFILLNKKSASANPTVMATSSTGMSNKNPLKNSAGYWVNQQPTAEEPNYYAHVLYPAMLRENPNVGNPNYRLTDQEAQQVLNNYTDLREALTNLSQSRHRPLYDVVRTNWNETAVPEMRTFLPFTPPFTTHYDGVLENPNASSGSWITKALGSVASFIPIVGGPLSDVITAIGAVHESVPTVMLNNREAEILITGGLIMQNMLPMFFDTGDGIAEGADAKLKELLEIYTRP